MSAEGAPYACPMDGVLAEEPGRCVSCGMPLMERERAERERRRFIEDPGAMMAHHPAMKPYIWCQAAVIALGAWLFTLPFAYPYEDRAAALNDMACGAAAAAIACWTLLRRERAWVSYANAFVGLWLMLAPLAFWAPRAATYQLDTLIGALLITFSFVLPMCMEMPGPEMPPGWTYNPSTWAQRVPIAALALLGFFLSRPMAGYQLGHSHAIWEPLFGEGTRRVLESDISRAWPVSDAGLGAMTYLLEFLSTVMGDPRRWRTMPWMVGIFGLAVIPLGLVSIVLVIMQPLAVGAWCTLCLGTAAAMLLMIPLSLDEVVASVQLLNAKRKEGESLWRVFWRGGSLPGAYRSSLGRRESLTARALAGGITGSWSLYLSSGIGAWLMAAPAALGGGGPAADADRLAGALAVTFSTIAWAETGRILRFVNIGLGLGLSASAWLLPGATTDSALNSFASGLALAALALPLGRIRDRYGSFDPWVSWPLRQARPSLPGSTAARR